MHPRTWPWWVWVACVVLVLCLGLVATAGVIRSQGMRELDAAIADLRGRGLGVLPRDLVAKAPPVDQGRQARAWALIGNGSATWDFPKTTTHGLSAVHAHESGFALRDSESQRILSASAAARSAWRQLRSEGPVVLSALGWMREDLPDPDRAGLERMAKLRIPNLLQSRNLALALATEARLAADPRPVLAELDALVEAYLPNGSLIDVMIGLAMATIRDGAWLEAVSRGIDPQPWINRSPDPLGMAADGFAAERMGFGGGFIQDMRLGTWSDPALAGGGASGFGSWFRSRLFWMTSPHDATMQLEGTTLGEQLARSGRGDIDAFLARLTAERWRAQFAAMALPNVLEAGVTNVGNEVSGRIHRIAGGLATAFPAIGLPELEAIAPVLRALLAATPRTPAIRYTRLSATRFRLDVDPATPATDLLPAGRVIAWKPTAKPFAQSQWGLEWELRTER